MKKTILILIAVIWALSGLSSHAHTGKEPYEVRIGWGGFPIQDLEIYGDGILRDIKPFYDPVDLDHIYGTGTGKLYGTGIISAEFSIHFKKWFSLAIEAGINGMWRNRFDKYDGTIIDKMHGISVSVIPHARFYWFNRKNIRLYSGIGIGMSLGAFDGKSGIYLTGQISPIGITAGQKVFFFAEQSSGTAYFGGKFGVGYRF